MNTIQSVEWNFFIEEELLTLWMIVDVVQYFLCGSAAILDDIRINSFNVFFWDLCNFKCWGRIWSVFEPIYFAMSISFSSGLYYVSIFLSIWSWHPSMHDINCETAFAMLDTVKLCIFKAYVHFCTEVSNDLSYD